TPCCFRSAPPGACSRYHAEGRSSRRALSRVRSEVRAAARRPLRARRLCLPLLLRPSCSFLLVSPSRLRRLHTIPNLGWPWHRQPNCPPKECRLILPSRIVPEYTHVPV